jgi:hypothetical protein
MRCQSAKMCTLLRASAAIRSHRVSNTWASQVSTRHDSSVWAVNVWGLPGRSPSPPTTSPLPTTLRSSCRPVPLRWVSFTRPEARTKMQHALSIRFGLRTEGARFRLLMPRSTRCSAPGQARVADFAGRGREFLVNFGSRVSPCGRGWIWLGDAGIRGQRGRRGWIWT